MPSRPDIIEYEPSYLKRLTAFLNEAYADLRALPPVGVEGPDYPEFSEPGIAARLHGEGEPRAFLMLDGGEIVSAAGCGPSGDAGALDLLFVGTAPGHRRRGYAAALLEACAQYAQSLGKERLRTGHWVDSRYAPACGLFGRCGFAWWDPENSNVTMEIDLDRWEPREPVLPPGYEIASFGPGDEQAWNDLRNAVFGGDNTVAWFRERFRDRPNFDPEGWFFVVRDGRKVGLSGAIVWFADEALTEPTGALMEWVGVLPEERGKGLGEALMVTCLNYLKRRAVHPNCLVTQPLRRAAVSLYEKLGYRVVREWRTYVRVLK